MDQVEYMSQIQEINFRKDRSFGFFRITKSKYAYATFSTVPEAIIHVAILALITEERFEQTQCDAQRLACRLQHIAYSKQSVASLGFVNISKPEIEIIVYIDITFAINQDKSSQLGILVMARDEENGSVNIIHFSSSKRKLVCKSLAEIGVVRIHIRI